MNCGMCLSRNLLSACTEFPVGVEGCGAGGGDYDETVDERCGQRDTFTRKTKVAPYVETLYLRVDIVPGGCVV